MVQMTSLVQVRVLWDLQLRGRAGTFVPNFSYKYSLASCRIKNIDETPFLFLRFYSKKTQKRLKDFT